MDTRLSVNERTFQGQVVDLAHLLGWMAYHTHDSRRSQPGFPDLVLVRDRVLFAELKTERGRVTTDQQRWHDALRSAGAEAYIWRPRQFDQVQRVLTRRKAAAG